MSLKKKIITAVLLILSGLFLYQGFSIILHPKPTSQKTITK